jgi:outer membrane receptor protein involved in Fe transport
MVQPAQAQTDPSPAPSSADNGEADAAAAASTDGPSESTDQPGGEILVTGSRINQRGYTAPTPVTVLDADSLAKSVSTNIPDALNKLPQLANSRSNNQSPVLVANSPQGGNYLNLRGIGLNRVLVLLDGQRLAPTTFEGAVDTNILPQLLVRQVDVVTAGASASYGSDAVSGVVNFVLDKNFTGIKGVANAGISSRGDNGLQRIGVAAGTALLDDRLHLEGSVEYYRSAGIDASGKLERGTNRAPMAVGTLGLGQAGTAANPYVTVFDARFATQSFGSVINSGPLAGNHFLPGGALVPYNAGTRTGTSGINVGGDGAYHNQMWLTPRLTNRQAFGRIGYEFSPSVSGYVYGNYAYSDFDQINPTQSVNAITIYSDNAFLQQSLTAAQRAQLGSTPSFSIGRRLNEDGGLKVNGELKSFTTGAGFEGNLGGDWEWDVNYTHSHSRLTIQQDNQIQVPRFAAAVDAVRDGSGNIVCRVNLTNPGLYPGCVPINLFGAGSPSAAALRYVLQASSFTVKNTLDDVNASISGSPFSLWAGPVNVVVGAEYREATFNQTSTADPALPVDFTGLRSPIANRLFNSQQVGVGSGSNNVKEAFGEIAVPLLKDLPFAEKFDVNGAIRYTDYSTSGGVTTWKAGFNYVPVQGIRFRGTISRDIRAPTLYELFAGTQITRQTFTDRQTNTTNELIVVSGGNRNLRPEIGRTKTIGVVLQPSFLPGFNASIDAFELKIEGGVSAVDATTVLNQCFADASSQFCSQIVRPISPTDTSPANFPTQVNQLSINLASELVRGIDFEVSQRFNVAADTRLDLRLLASYVPKRSYQTLQSVAPLQTAGAIWVNGPNGYPKLAGSVQVDLTSGPFNLFVQERLVGAMDRNWNPLQVFTQHRYGPVFYTDLTASVDLGALGGREANGESNATLFVNVNNLFDRKPPLVADTSSPGLYFPTASAVYDVVGRFMSAGVRFRF